MLIFGFTAILGQLISIEALPLVWLRMGIASILIFLYLIFKKKISFSRPVNLNKTVIAGLIITAHWVLFFHSIKVSNVSVCLSGMSTAAFFGSILEPLMNKRKIDFKELLLGILVIAGLYLIFRFEAEFSLGLIFAMLSAALGALFSILNAQLVKDNAANKITFIEMLSGFVAIPLFLSLTGDISSLSLSLSQSDWMYLLILGGICTAYPFIETVSLMKEIRPFNFLIAINLEPIYGIILAYFIFNEGQEMTIWFYLGAAIILATVFVDILLKRMARKRQVKTY